MLRGQFESAATQSPAELRNAYDRLLGETIGRVGVDRIGATTGIGTDLLSALANGESPEITVETAATILGADETRPDADTIEAEARELLLMGMSTAVLDVETLASRMDAAFEPKEIQQKIEGRHPMTLAEYAQLHSHIEGEKR